MKKMLTLMLAVLLVMSLIVPAAASSVSPVENSVVIQTTINPSYTVTIPKDITVGFNEQSTSFGTVRLESARLEPNKCVKVTLNADNLLENKADPSKTIAYAINIADTQTAYTSVEYLEVGDETALNLCITEDAWNSAYAGTYSDTVTFTISYTDITTTP